MSNPLWSRFFNPAKEDTEEEVHKAAERLACILDLVSRPGYKSEILDWLEDQVRVTRVIPGPHENMLYQSGMRDGYESVLDHLKRLHEMAKE
jgi:hypothetical protein